MLEADILSNEGQSDEGMAIIEALRRRPEAIPGDCTYMCLRASMLVNKAMTALQTGEGMQMAQQIFQVSPDPSAMMSFTLHCDLLFLLLFIAISTRRMRARYTCKPWRWSPEPSRC